MNIIEYEKVKGYTYLEYCDYLQNKYGIGLSNYMTKSWVKNPKCSRTKEGLMVHHKFENYAIRLSKKVFAEKHPFEWQQAENLIYCDFLEHLFLHLLICEEAIKNNTQQKALGIRGIIFYIVPELNDVFCGWRSKLQWQINCHEKIINDKAVYLIILKRFKEHCSEYPFYHKDCLHSSLNDKFGIWSIKNNKVLFQEIDKL